MVMEQPKTGMPRRDFVKSAGIALGGVTAASALTAGYLVRPEKVNADTTAEMQANYQNWRSKGYVRD